MINNKGHERICCILLIFLFILSACATEPQRAIIKDEPPLISEPVLSIDAVDKKISALEDLLENDRVLEEDRVAVANLILDYHRIKVLLQGNLSQKDYREIILMLFNELSLLDERYFFNQGQINDNVYIKVADDLNLKKQGILKKYTNKDYKGVIIECSELEKAFGKESLTFETGILLAISLAEEGRLNEAIDKADIIIKDIEERPDLIQLRAGLVQWRIDTGKKEAALREYQKLIEDMDERQVALAKATGRINSQNNTSAGSDQVLDRILDEQSNPDINSRVASMLKEIEKLEKQGDFTSARLLLLKWKLRTDDQNEFAEINRALLSLDLSEKQYLEQMKTDRREGVETAVKLIEKEDYESAIAMLDRLKISGESSPELDKQRDVAVERLINQERNRAAKIFLAARKTDDIKKKKELLLSAHDILIGLIEKYPSSQMSEKIKSNLDSVDGELRKTNN